MHVIIFDGSYILELHKTRSAFGEIKLKVMTVVNFFQVLLPVKLHFVMNPKEEVSSRATG